MIPCGRCRIAFKKKELHYVSMQVHRAGKHGSVKYRVYYCDSCFPHVENAVIPKAREQEQAIRQALSKRLAEVKELRRARAAEKRATQAKLRKEAF